MTTLTQARLNGAASMRDHRTSSARQQLHELLKARGPMLLTEIAEALGWQRERAYSIIRHAEDHGALHGINGPLRRLEDRKYAIGAAQPRKFRNVFCPACGNADIRQLKSGWRCYSCRETFESVREGDRSSRASGSGVVAGPTYARGFRWGAM